MVTVATSLDVPIKLVFPGPKRGGMLGLGDVVLPGIMMALALRYDLYLHYLRKQDQPSPDSVPVSTSNTILTASADTVTKPQYINATGNWGERYWTSSPPTSVLTVPKSQAETYNSPATFRKTYFHASMIGYIIGMLATLIVLNVYQHAQPALLYLVPGVLGALWGTAFARGEIGEMWRYSEDEDLEDSGKARVDGKVEVDVTNDGPAEKAPEGGVATAQTDVGAVEDRYQGHVFYFALSKPKRNGLAGPKKDPPT